MSRLCEITGAKPVLGTSILRSGKAKKKGGIGTHVTANTPRVFQPNLKEKRIFVPELKRYVTVKLTAPGAQDPDQERRLLDAQKSGRDLIFWIEFPEVCSGALYGLETRKISYPATQNEAIILRIGDGRRCSESELKT